MERMEAAGVRMSGAPIAYYLPAPAGPGDESITVHAAFPFTGEPPADPGFDIVDLPAIEAATLLHHGDMAEVVRTGQVIAKWIDDNSYRMVGDEPRPRGVPGLPARRVRQVGHRTPSRGQRPVLTPVRRGWEA